MDVNDDTGITDQQATTADPTEDPNAEADFLAGFQSQRGGDEPSAATAQESSDSDPAAAASQSGSDESQDGSTGADDTGAGENATQQTAEQQAVAAANLTAEEVAALRAQAGKVPELQRELQDLKAVAGRVSALQSAIAKLEQVKATTGDPAVAAGAGRVLELKELAQEYPSLAKALANDLAAIIPGAAPAPTVDPALVEQLVQQRVAEQTEVIEARVERRLLEREHPDYVETIAAVDSAGNVIKTAEGKFVPSDDFVQWLGAQGGDFARQFVSTNDSAFLGKAITNYKQHKASRAQAAARKTNRLERAVGPSGVPPAAPPSPTETDEFLAGYKAVRGSV